MKNILENISYQGISPIGKIVHYLIHEQRVLVLDPCQKGEDVRCPRCKNAEGVLCLEKGAYAWICVNENCLQRVNCQGQKSTIEIPKFTYDQFGIPMSMHNVDLAKCSMARKADFLSEWVKNPRGFFLFEGPPGRGKSSTAAAMMKFYIDLGNTDGYYFKAYAIYEEWREIMGSGLSLKSLKSRIMSKKFAVIDDLAQKFPTEGFREFLFDILDCRLENPKLGTLITTNKGGKELQDALGDSIVSRLLSGKFLKFENSDLRRSKTWENIP